MNKNNKKGFTLAEVLIILLIVSMMVAAFAPVMSKKKTRKKFDPKCTGGVKELVAEYKTHGTYTFTAPEAITGEATITLIGAGGKGGNGYVELDTEGKIIRKQTGGGGGGGNDYETDITFIANERYDITVGGGSDTNNTSISGKSVNFTIQRGGDGQDGSNYGNGSGSPQGGGDGQDSIGGNGGAPTIYYSYGIQGGAAGSVCYGSDYCQNGKPGSGYTQNNNIPTGFTAGTGGGGGGVDLNNKTGGVGGRGGDGYVRIKYKVRCE